MKNIESILGWLFTFTGLVILIVAIATGYPIVIIFGIIPLTIGIVSLIIGYSKPKPTIYINEKDYNTPRKIEMYYKDNPNINNSEAKINKINNGEKQLSEDVSQVLERVATSSNLSVDEFIEETNKEIEAFRELYLIYGTHLTPQELSSALTKYTMADSEKEKMQVFTSYIPNGIPIRDIFLIEIKIQLEKLMMRFGCACNTARYNVFNTLMLKLNEITELDIRFFYESQWSKTSTDILAYFRFNYEYCACFILLLEIEDNIEILKEDYPLFLNEVINFSKERLYIK